MEDKEHNPSAVMTGALITLVAEDSKKEKLV